MLAATAAMTGAATCGGLCDPEAAGPDSCSVYNIKFTVKTLAAKKRCEMGARWLVTDTLPGPGVWRVWWRNKNADTAAAGDPAGDGTQVTVADYVNSGRTTCEDGTGLAIADAAQRWVYWMDNATRKFEGVAWQCRSACFEGVLQDCDLTNNGRLNYVIWEKKTGLAVSYPVFQVKSGQDDGTKFTGETHTLYFSLDAQRDMFIGRYGNKAQKVAAYWTPRLLHAQTIAAAGFGTYDVKNLRTKSVSGNAVGMIMPVSEGAADPCGNKDRIFCALGFMCVEWLDWCCDGCYAGVELVPASGTWSLKYNASATKKANADKATLADFVPAYMFYKHDAWKDARAADPWLHTDNYYWWGDSTGGLLYRENRVDNDDGLTNDQILDRLAEGAAQVINFVFEGVVTTETKDEPVVDEDGYPIDADEDGESDTKKVTRKYVTYGFPRIVYKDKVDESGDPVDEDGDGVTDKEMVIEEPKYEVIKGVIALPDDLFELPSAKAKKEAADAAAAAEE